MLASYAKDRHQPIHKSEQILFVRLVALETITYTLEWTLKSANLWQVTLFHD